MSTSVRKSPAERYIIYLLTHPDTYSTPTIIEMLQLSHLDFLGVRYIELLRASLSPPDPFLPYDKNHIASQQFLLASKIYYFYFPDEAQNNATALLHDPAGKHDLEALLIAKAPPEYCVYRMRSRGLKADVATVKRYSFLYFNVDAVDGVELDALMRLRYEHTPVSETDDPYAEKMAAAMKKASYGDMRRFGASVGAPELAGVFVDGRFGNSTNRLNLPALLKAGITMATARSVMCTSTTGQLAASDAKSWAETAHKLKELQDSIGSPDTDLQEELQKIAMQTDNTEVPHITALSGGDHTTDMQAKELLEAKNE